jgi:hypothetical protein
MGSAGARFDRVRPGHRLVLDFLQCFKLREGNDRGGYPLKAGHRYTTMVSGF